jgi:putative transposase
MTRKRICPIGYPIHIIQRGNNKQDCFISDGDRKAYLSFLITYSKKFHVEVHAWVLMDNHVHLLCTPKKENAVSQMMQSLGRMYVQNFNSQHKRTGTLWEGRFKSFLIESKRYLLEVYRYIELNPVRAGIVKNPENYSWSSHLFNAYGINSNLCTQHDEYLNLGEHILMRQNNYKMLFQDKQKPEILKKIRTSLLSSLVLGNRDYISNLEMTIMQCLTKGKPGRRWK